VGFLPNKGRHSWISATQTTHFNDENRPAIEQRSASLNAFEQMQEPFHEMPRPGTEQEAFPIPSSVAAHLAQEPNRPEHTGTNNRHFHTTSFSRAVFSSAEQGKMTMEVCKIGPRALGEISENINGALWTAMASEARARGDGHD
jgi:hypothetical protein